MTEHMVKQYAPRHEHMPNYKSEQIPRLDRGRTNLGTHARKDLKTHAIAQM